MSKTQLKINVLVSEKDAFHVFDETGLFDKNKNPKGWNGSNDQISNVVKAFIRVYLPDGSHSDVSVFPDFPNVDCIGYEIIPSDLGLETFSPGIYRFDYFIQMYDGVIIDVSCTFFHSEPLYCCVKKKKMQTSLTDASSELSKKVIELEVLLENAETAACLGDMDCVKKITDYIWTNCGCCC